MFLIQSAEYLDNSGREHAGYDSPPPSSDLAWSLYPPFFLAVKTETDADSTIVGQTAYESRISRRTEYKPLSVGLIGAKGIQQIPSLTCFFFFLPELMAYGVAAKFR